MIKTDFLNFTLEMDTELEYIEFDIYNNNNGKYLRVITKTPMKNKGEITEQTLVYAFEDFVISVVNFGERTFEEYMENVESKFGIEEGIDYREIYDYRYNFCKMYDKICDEDVYELNQRVREEIKRLYN